VRRQVLQLAFCLQKQWLRLCRFPFQLV
jgi:hypothetical protein